MEKLKQELKDAKIRLLRTKIDEVEFLLNQTHAIKDRVWRLCENEPLINENDYSGAYWSELHSCWNAFYDVLGKLDRARDVLLEELNDVKNL